MTVRKRGDVWYYDFQIKGVPGVGDEIKLIVAIEGVKE